MDDLEQKSMTDLYSESTAGNTAPKLPPQESAAEETLWGKSIHRILAGVTLTAITWNIGFIYYVLPAIGTLLLLFGFRPLQQENKWFRCCYILSILRTAYFCVILILNTTILQSTMDLSAAIYALPTIHLLLQLTFFVCFWRGFISIRQKAGLSPHAGSAAALIVWYVLMNLLALVRFSGLIIILIMLIAYCRILYNINHLSKELDKAGYEISALPVKWTTRRITIVLLVLVVIGGACGYLFGGRYPMEWTARSAEEHKNVEDIKAQLTDLGFPAYVLNDFSPEDIAACRGALRIVVKEGDIPFDNYAINPDSSEDIKTLHMTNVSVKVSDDRERWIIFHHFLWDKAPEYYGTEAIQLRPVYTYISEGWSSGGDVTGRVLYDSNEETFVADYYSLDTQTYTSSSFFFGSQDNTDVFATFSLPQQGSSYRGYIAYPIEAVYDGYIISDYFDYIHQKSWKQYPVMTAMEAKMRTSLGIHQAFQVLEDGLDFYPSEEGIS